ncbi:MAG: hypothetical protein JWP97_359 [Labilithrix sp.]|nr:hypothetical protein [Labilithrix sp.]
MRALGVLVPLFLGLGTLAGGAACTAPAPAEEGVNVRVTRKGEDPRIIGGVPSTATQDSTVFIQLAEGFCTGSLITPNLVLTARHCVSQMAGNDDCGHFTTDDDPTTMGIALGADASLTDTPTIVAHGTQLFHETNPSGCSYDIALLQLDKDVPGVTVSKLRFTPPTVADVGLAIGYGDGDDHGTLTNGRYQRTGITVSAIGPATTTYKTLKNRTISVTVAPGEFLSSESTCFGDSGGPLLDAAGLVIGVTSRGVDDFCVDRPSVWSDVYSHLAMIEAAATTAGHPLNAPPATPDAGATPDASPSVDAGTSSSSGGLGEPAEPDAGDTHAADGETTTTTSGCSTTPARQGGGSAALAVAVGALALVTARRRRNG